MLDVHVRPAWHTSAACRGKIDVLYTEAAGRNVYDGARGLCAACPGLAECRAEGDRTESARWQTFGFRAGESPVERLGRRRAMRTYPTAV